MHFGVLPHLQSLRPRHVRGFTMLEVIIVMLILSLVIGSGIVLLRSSDYERDLRNSSSELEAMMLESRHKACLYRQPRYVVFGNNYFAFVDGEVLPQNFARENFTSYVGLPENTKFEFLRWGEKNWRQADSKQAEVLRLDPSGVNEPFSVRFSNNGGHIEQEYSPLSSTPELISQEIR